jgi:hypothetical protein
LPGWRKIIRKKEKMLLQMMINKNSHLAFDELCRIVCVPKPPSRLGIRIIFSLGFQQSLEMCAR